MKRKQPDLSRFQWVEDHIAASSLAYQEVNESAISDTVQLSHDWTFYKNIDSAQGLRAKLWINPTTGDILVGFRGTSSIAEAKIDARMGATAFMDGKGVVRGNVYKGFGDAWDEMRTMMDLEIDRLRQHNYTNAIQFTGHSLGGAMAEIASVYYSSKYTDALVYETSVGAPSSGDKSFGSYARSIQNLNMTRIIAPGDPVANVKLPGMDYPEKDNVINIGGSRQKSGMTVDDMFKAVNPVIGSMYQGYKNHSLETYSETLVKDFGDYKHTSLEESDTSFLDSKISGIATEECRCECHAYDAAIARGEKPPPSLGSLNIPAPPEQQESPPTQTTSSTALEQPEQSPQVEYDVSDSVLAALDEQEVEDRNNKSKLQARYSELMGKDDLDPVALSRKHYLDAADDLQYYDKRIEMELQHPSLVPNDDGSRDVAVSFKNKLNRLYAVILQSKAKSQLIPAKADVDVTADQIEQEQSAKSNHLLSPDEQPNEWIFDTTLLSDIEETESPASEKQLQEWLGYPGMTPRKLYDMLKTEYSSKYKDERLMKLRETDEKLKQDTVEQIKQQLEGDDLAIQRKETFNVLSQDARFKRLFKDGKVDVRKMVRDYRPETFDVSKILGYDPKTYKEVMSTDYHDQLDKMTRETDPSTWQQATLELDKIYDENLKYPWLSGKQFREVYKKYEGDEDALQNALLQLEPPLPENYKPQKLESYVPKNDNIEIEDPSVKNYFEIQDKAFEDPENLKRLFQKWNGGKVSKGLTKDVLGLITSGISGIDHLIQDKNNRGWYKGDQFLGLKADRTLMEYLKRHPDSDIQYRTPNYSKTLETASHGANTLLETFTGIDPEGMQNYVSDAFNLNIPEGQYLDEIPKKEETSKSGNIGRTVGGAMTAAAIYQRLNEKGMEGMVNPEKTEQVVSTANKFKSKITSIIGKLPKIL